MSFSKIYNFIFILLGVGLCFPSVSQSHFDSDISYQQTREKNIALATADLQVEEYGANQKDVTTDTLKPRFEANWRYSDDRSILMGEFWLPLLQCEKESVLFCDIRLMGDDNENKEFNVGVGYREVLEDTILGDGVAGAMLWFDRRFTDRDFQFNQVTVGGEWLGEQYDLRMNGYFPIDKKNSYVQANPNGSGAGFVGNQLLVNTDQVVVEEVLPGIDFEVGAQLNFMNGVTDSTRFFVGGYHFDGDIAEDITGLRTRIASDITSDIQVGARFQHDDVRGSQTYVESTIRFPFGHKKKYKREGIWSRLDESPERDIDVVSNEVVTVQGTNEPLLNATTGLQQNVIHVDNTAAAGGNGSIETPYNTLGAAEGIATTNDLIYVHAGDSATTNQNVGITLDDAGQMLAGSGTDLLYNTERFKTPNGNNITGVLVEATTAPMITNGAGNGVDITADNIFVSGVTVDGATSNGIYALNADNVIIDNVTSDNNTSSGIYVDANASNLSLVTLTNNRADANGVHGLYANAVNGGDIGNVKFTSNIASNNTLYGIYSLANGVGSTIATAHFTNNILDTNSTGIRVNALSGADIGEIKFTSNRVNNNTIYGIYSLASGVGSTITTALFTSNTFDANSTGIRVDALSAGDIGIANFTGNTATNNTGAGFFAGASGAGSEITTATFLSNVFDANSTGITAAAVSDGDIGTVNYTSNIAMNSTSYGFYAQASGAGSSITTTNFTSNTADSGGGVGIYVQAVSAGDITTANLTSNTATNNANSGFTAQASGAGSVITTANFTNNTANMNTQAGFLTNADAGGNIGTTNFNNNLADNNSFYGLWANAANAGQLTTVNFTSNKAINNTNYGLMAQSNGAGSTITAADFTNNTSDSNGIVGVFIYALTDGDIVQTSLEDNIVTNNGAYGVRIDDDSAAGGIAADLGGGAFGSTGGNSVSGSTSEELLVDLDGGALKAENNWWGSASGLAGGETLLQDASTVDTTPFLTSDPGL